MGVSAHNIFPSGDCHISAKSRITITIIYCNGPNFSDRWVWTKDQTAPEGAFWSGSTLFAIPSVQDFYGSLNQPTCLSGLNTVASLPSTIKIRQIGLGKQSRSRSDCSGSVWSRSTVFAIPSPSFEMHHSMIQPPCSNFRVVTATFSGVRIFRSFTVTSFCY